MKTLPSTRAPGKNTRRVGSPDAAPAGTALEFLPCCGLVAVGRLIADGELPPGYATDDGAARQVVVATEWERDEAEVLGLHTELLLQLTRHGRIGTERETGEVVGARRLRNVVEGEPRCRRRRGALLGDEDEVRALGQPQARAGVMLTGQPAEATDRGGRDLQHVPSGQQLRADVGEDPFAVGRTLMQPRGGGQAGHDRGR